ncbi:phosphoglycerate kinase [Rubritalea marina]|uniref:phosphoglycerate kinase n=1 Tax=Rubritalea marina TaxID=361055 RepID=UPI0003775F91|nr:phosphoglycerate kinase [Rubritalea marina]
MPKLTIRDIDVQDKEVLMRADFNVPYDDDNNITDDTRIVGALPTIQYLLEGGAKLVLCSHKGRPAKKRESLEPVAKRLAELLGQEVAFACDTVGEDATAKRAALSAGKVVLLENTRFEEGETKNSPELSKQLAGEASIFVNDAFGTAHRAHASTEGVSKFVEQSAMGFLIEKELEFLEGKLESPAKPFLAIMGGAKVSDKIQVIKAMMDKADEFIIGGAMAYTFRLAQGYQVGDSLVEPDFVELAKEILKDAETKGIKFHLPTDTRITQEFSPSAQTKVTQPYAEGGGIDDGWEGIDIGDAAIPEFEAVVARAGTILWNGPMGVFEMDNFAIGTKALTAAVAKSDALTIVGGGDSVTAANKFANPSDFDFLSTGGGASLELLEGKTLPGVAALSDQ